MCSGSDSKDMTRSRLAEHTRTWRQDPNAPQYPGIGTVLLLQGRGLRRGHPGPATGAHGLPQQLLGQVLDLDLARNQEEIDKGPDEEKPAGQEPDQARHPSAEVEPVKSQNPEAAENPEKIRDWYAFHGNYLGRSG